MSELNVEEIVLNHLKQLGFKQARITDTRCELGDGAVYLDESNTWHIQCGESYLMAVRCEDDTRFYFNESFDFNQSSMLQVILALNAALANSKLTPE